jgi:serine/threonine protein kinase
VLSRQEYDGKVDVWSIGIIFYELLTKRTPYNGRDEADLLNNIRRLEFPVPSYFSKLVVNILTKVSLEIDKLCSFILLSYCHCFVATLSLFCCCFLFFIDFTIILVIRTRSKSTCCHY